MILCCYLLSSAHAQRISMNDHWKFAKGDIDVSMLSQQAVWTNITLPHTWNGYDGQDGGDDYYRGTGWYMRALSLDKNDRGKCIYLRFGAANYLTEVYLNGVLIGTHSGGYTAFAFDITPFVRYGMSNQLLVKVSNADGLPIPPLSADFTFFGGLIRGVELIKKNKLHITAEDYGSNGVYVRQDKVSDKEAILSFTAKVRNTEKNAQKAVISFFIKERDGKVLKETKEEKMILPKTTMPITSTFRIGNPHLWNGKKDPYLYIAEVKVKVGSEIVDNYTFPLGIRYP